MARRRRTPKDPPFSPMIGEFAYAEDKGQYFKVRVIERMRTEGINKATIRFQDRGHQRLPTGGLAVRKIRDLLEHMPEQVEEESDERVAAPAKTQPKKRPTFDVVNTINTPLNNRYDFGIHAHGCADVKRDRMRYGCDVYPHYEQTPEEVQAAEIDDLEAGGFDRDAAEAFSFKIFPCARPAQARPKRGSKRRGAKSARFAGASATAKKPLQSELPSGSLHSARPRRARKATIITQPKEDHVARRSAASAATKEAPAKTRGRKAKVEPEETNGGERTRLTHEDKLRLVPEILKRLKAGESFSDIRSDPDMPSSGLRKALFEKGYDTKGNRIESDEDLSELEGKALVREVVKMRQNGVPWYRIELAADMGQGELKDMLIDAGHEDLTARVSRAADEEVEEAPKPRGRKRAPKEEPAEEEAKPARRRGRSRRSNPSDEA